MQTFTMVMICCVMLSDFIVDRFNLPPLARFVPEMISGVVVVYVLVAGTFDRFRFVAPKYWLVGAALVLVVLCGAINNDPGAGPLISGMRFYFRAVPLFFLAAVLPTTEEQLMRQLKLVLGLSLLQLPIAGYQRWVVMRAERWTGDDVRGSIGDSGVLSMFLICAGLVLTGLLLKRRLSAPKYALLLLLLLLPTTINETKVTVIYLPFGLFVTLIMGAESGKRLRYAGMALAFLAVFGTMFIVIYNKMEELNPARVDIVDFFTNERTLESYVIAKGNGHAVGIGGTKIAHRGEAISMPLKYLAKDPALLAFGLGLGSASPSKSGASFEGRYYALFASFLTISFTSFVLELGLFGIALIVLLNGMIFADSLAVARRDDSLTGAVAAGWPGVVAIFMLGIFYDAFHLFTAVTFLYWYFSGLICARRMALRDNTTSMARATMRLAAGPSQPAPHGPTAN